MKLLLFLLSFSVFAGESFVPPHGFRIEADDKLAQGLTEDEYHAVIDRIESTYKDIVSTFGAELKVERLWKNGNVNAEAEQFGKTWVVRMFGGMARYRTMTADAYGLVMCHELGHHIGGSPRYKEDKTWATNEGQADYFATLKCLRRLWTQDDNIQIISKLKYRPLLRDLCAKQWIDPTDQAVCIRSAHAGTVVAEMIAFLGRKISPWIERPDPSEVEATYDLHNSPQCRLDTFLQASLCEKNFHEDVSFDSDAAGVCYQTVGSRPLCWFKPQL